MSRAAAEAASLAAQLAHFGRTVTYTSPTPGSVAVAFQAAPLRSGPLEEVSRGGSRDRMRTTAAELARVNVTLARGGVVQDDAGVSYIVANIESPADGVVVMFLDRL